MGDSSNETSESEKFFDAEKIRSVASEIPTKRADEIGRVAKELGLIVQRLSLTQDKQKVRVEVESHEGASAVTYVAGNEPTSWVDASNFGRLARRLYRRVGITVENGCITCTPTFSFNKANRDIDFTELINALEISGEADLVCAFYNLHLSDETLGEVIELVEFRESALRFIAIANSASTLGQGCRKSIGDFANQLSSALARHEANQTMAKIGGVAMMTPTPLKRKIDWVVDSLQNGDHTVLIERKQELSDWATTENLKIISWSYDEKKQKLHGLLQSNTGQSGGALFQLWSCGNEWEDRKKLNKLSIKLHRRAGLLWTKNGIKSQYIHSRHANGRVVNFSQLNDIFNESPDQDLASVFYNEFLDLKMLLLAFEINGFSESAQRFATSEFLQWDCVEQRNFEAYAAALINAKKFSEDCLKFGKLNFNVE